MEERGNAARRPGRRLAQWRAPVPALPLAAFRVAAAALTAVYLMRLVWEAPSLHGSGSLLDQALTEEALWFTWQPLFRPDAPLWLHRGILMGGVALSAVLALGWRTRWVAAALYGIVVCSIRSRFVVASIDDGIVHLLLFWLILLPDVGPLGKRLLLRQAPGFAVRAAGLNFALIYAVAGGTKWLSPMWRDGSALHAIMALRPSWIHGHVDAVPEGLWVAGNYGALCAEPLFALIPFLAAHGRAKRWLGAVWLAFHLGIIATFDVAIANFACLALGGVVFRDELQALALRLVGRRQRKRRWVPVPRLRAADAAAALTVVLLIGAMASSVGASGWRRPQTSSEVVAAAAAPLHESAATRAWYGPLWCVGLMQQYRLMDWIDDRNHAVDFSATVNGQPVAGFDDTWLAPAGMRGSLALSFLVGATWSRLDPRTLRRLQGHQRGVLAARVAARSAEEGLHVVEAEVTRTRLGQDCRPRRVEVVRFYVDSHGDVAVMPRREDTPCVASSL